METLVGLVLLGLFIALLIWAVTYFARFLP